jgi:hypothetical protein
MADAEIARKLGTNCSLLYKFWHREECASIREDQKLLTAKIAKNFRKARKADRCRSSSRPLRPFLATLAVKGS